MLVDSQLRSVIADHRGKELFDPRSALDLRARHGARYRGGVTVMLVVLSLLVLVLFLLSGGELLMQLPQLELQLLKRVPMRFKLWIALQIPAPPVFFLQDDVFSGMHEGKYIWSFQVRK